MTILTIDLPDNLIKEAKIAGLLAPNAIEAMLRETLRQLATNELFIAADKLADSSFPPMSMKEIQQEVNAVRAGKK